MLVRGKVSRDCLRKFGLSMTAGVDKHQSAISSKSFSAKSSVKHKTDFETKRPGSGPHIDKDNTELYHLKYKEKTLFFCFCLHLWNSLIHFKGIFKVHVPHLTADFVSLVG